MSRSLTELRLDLMFLKKHKSLSKWEIEDVLNKYTGVLDLRYDGWPEIIATLELMIYEKEQQNTLTKENIKIGLVVFCKNHPEWGTWRIDKDRSGWILNAPHGGKILSEEEFHFWTIAK